MGKKCDLEAPGPPDRDKWSLPQLAELLGYDDGQSSIRRLVAEGRLPRPRGHGESQYYTPLDVAVIVEMFGRWSPAEPSARTRKDARERAKTPEDVQEDES